MKSLALWSLLFALTPVYGSINSRIVTDDDVLGKTVVSVTGIAYGKDKSSRTHSECTGVAIAPRWVLTAGHCLPDKPHRTFVIGYAPTKEFGHGFDEDGALKLEPGEQEAEAAFMPRGYAFAAHLDEMQKELEKRTHGLDLATEEGRKEFLKVVQSLRPKFVEANRALEDLMLVRVRALPKGKSVATMMPKASPFEGPALAMGFGLNESPKGKRAYADGSMRAVDYTETTVLAKSKEISAVPAKKRAFVCTGDSGGPLFQKSADGFRVRGIASREDGQNSCESSSTEEFPKAVWTDVPEFADWIACVTKTDDADIEKKCVADRVTGK